MEEMKLYLSSILRGIHNTLLVILAVYAQDHGHPLISDIAVVGIGLSIIASVLEVLRGCIRGKA